MIVAIVHYHLQRGGVTRVIEHALRALPDTVRPVVLCGEPPPSPWPCPVRVIEGLGYEGPTPTRSADDLARDMTEAVRGGMGRPPDLWHIHNHSLGKNAALTGAVSALARQGHHLLLQIHDLPEDGRPANYAHLAAHTDRPLYPAAAHVHYAVINRRDGTFLRRAGLPDRRLHALPNAVWVDTAGSPDPGPSVPRFLYPTRAIRRKNLGEFLLWASAAEPGHTFAVTLSPRNPAARRVYDRWVAVSRELHVPVTFDIGADGSRSFQDLVRSAHTVVTTSVAEGFGLAFLEPWLLGRPVAGRNLPDITGEFTAAGVQLPGLYERLEVPLDRIDLPGLERRLHAALSTSYAAYQRPLPPSAVRDALGSMIHQGQIDFGRLDEQEQEHLLRTGVDSRGLQTTATAAQIAANARAISEGYSLASYRTRLEAAYARVVESDTGEVGELSASALLDAFLDPSRFNLLRT